MLTFALAAVIGVAVQAEAQTSRSSSPASTSSRPAPALAPSQRPKKLKSARPAKSTIAPTRAPEPSRSDPAGTVPQGAPGTQNPTIPAERRQPAGSYPRDRY